MTRNDDREPAEGEEGRQPPGVRDYTLLCLGGLVLVGLVLLQDNLGFWALVPLLLGGVSLLTYWSIGPALLLLSLTALMALRRRVVGYYPGFDDLSSALANVLLSGGVMAYVVGHYRLQSLMGHAVPWDRRRARRPEKGPASGRWFLPRAAGARAPRLATSAEVAKALVLVPFFALLGYVVWVQLSLMEFTEPLLDLPGPLGQTLAVFWVLLVAVVAGWALSGYLDRARASPEESLMYLQDQVWKQTRGEQRRLNRWLVWARTRAQRRREER